MSRMPVTAAVQYVTAESDKVVSAPARAHHPHMAEKPHLLITRKLPTAVEVRAQRDYQARLNATDEPYGREELVRAAEGSAAILCTTTDRFDAAAIGRLPDSVRMLATFSVGFEHIDLAAARARGMIVTNTPDVLTDATADVALLLILGAARRASEGEQLIRDDAWTGWAPTHLLGIHVGGKRLGILGMGRIGRAVSARARAFGMAVHYHNRQRLSPQDEAGATFHADAEDLLAVADILSIHFPHMPETRYFLDARRIELLPRNAIVVNTARGAVIKDADLIAALKSGRVAAAGLDVYDGEPRLHPEYRTLPSTFLLPHLGSATRETREAMGFRALDNLDAYFSGGKPRNQIA
jgi:lactate dehydrogenase-like 2-hydroxyacid dehydrogenase